MNGAGKNDGPKGESCGSDGPEARRIKEAAAVKRISIVIPARNEEGYLPACLSSIYEAHARAPQSYLEVIVVLNRCTDGTEDIARRAGCRVVFDESKNLAKIRNAGARAAGGEILITIDADSRMSENMLTDIVRKLDSGKVIGGGVQMYPERWSLGILLTGLLLVPLALYYGGISGGLFYCKKEDFDAIGGFNENLVSVEDVDFAYRLKRYGKTKGKRFSTIFSSYIVTSCRKFDRLGDWYFLKHPRQMFTALRGKDQAIADEFWYDYRR